MKSFLVILGALALASFAEAMHPTQDSEEEIRYESGSNEKHPYETPGRSLVAEGAYYGGAGQAGYVVGRPRTGYPVGYGKAGYETFVESEHVTSVSISEDRAVISRGKSFIRIIWDLITLLPKSAIRHGLFIPRKIAKFIYVVGKTILLNIENTINSRISFWKDDILGGIKNNFVQDFISVRDVLRELLEWVNRGFELVPTSTIDVPEIVFNPILTKLRSLTRDLPTPSSP